MNFKDLFIGYQPNFKSYLIPIYKNAISQVVDLF